jgi:hypothetical protein
VALDPLGWVVWGFLVRGIVPGLALPETVGVLGLHAWALYVVFPASR